MFKEDGNVIHFAAPKGTSPYHALSSQNRAVGVHWPCPDSTSDACWLIHGGQIVVHASVPSNTFAVYGNGEDKELTELVPGILNQLGPDSLASLRKLAESYQSLQKKDGGEGAKGDDDDEDDIPDLVEGENFESKVE